MNKNQFSNEPLKVWETGEVKTQKEIIYKRFTLKNILSEVLDHFFFDKGIPYTAKKLTLAPRGPILGALDTDRDRYTRPVKYFILWSGIYVFLVLKFGLIENPIQAQPGDDPEEIGQLADIFQNYFLNYLNLWGVLTVVFIAFFSFIFYRKTGLNYMEHLIMIIYISGHLYLFNILWLSTKPLMSVEAHSSLETLIAVGYYFWVFKNVFQKSIGITLVKTLLIVGLGFIFFILTVAMVFLVYGISVGLENTMN